MLTRNAIKITIEGLLCLARSDALLLSAASSSATALSSINTQTPPSYNLLQALNARGVNLIDFCFSILLKCLQTISEHVADHQISLLPLLRCAAELSVMAHRWYALFTPVYCISSVRTILFLILHRRLAQHWFREVRRRRVFRVCWMWSKTRLLRSPPPPRRRPTSLSSAQRCSN